MAGFAVAIGINQFEKYPNATLNFCADDAEGLGTVLARGEDLVHEFCDVRVLTDEEATRNNVIDTIDDCFSSSGSGDQVWLFIASHGYRRGTSNYILTHDTRAGSNAAKDGTCLKLDEIRRLLAGCKATDKIVLLDCCHASSADFIERSTGEDAFSTRVVKQTFSSQSFVFLNACAEGEVAHESPKLKHGIWSHYLLHALNGDQAAWTSSGSLTVHTLHDYLYKSVSRYVREELDRNQHPDCEFKAGLSSIVLGQRPSALPLNPRPSRVGQKVRGRNTVTARQAKRVASLAEDTVLPLLEEVGQLGSAELLQKVVSKWQTLTGQHPRSPVAMLGHMGCGKTTLLNALCGQQLGASGGGGARSAVSLTVRHRPDSYVVRANYLSLDEIRDVLAAEVSANADVLDLLSGIDSLDASPAQAAALEGIVTNASAIQSGKLTLDDLQPGIRDLVRKGADERTFAGNESSELVDFVGQHADSNGPFWRITKEVEIAGPLPGLPSGVEIMDLPGFGDLDELRLARIRGALDQVHQVVVVTDARGIDRDVRSALVDTGLVASILMSPHIEQITFVGSHIDYGRVSNSDRKELGLAEDYTAEQAVQAQFNFWVRTVQKHWEDILRAQIARARCAAYRDLGIVLERTRFIPTSPEGYLCLVGLQRDPTGHYKGVFPSGRGDALQVTGIAAVHSALAELLENRKKLLEEKLDNAFSDLCDVIHDVCTPLARSLSSKVAVSKQDAAAMDGHLRKVSKIAGHREVVTRLQATVLGAHSTKLDEADAVVQEHWRGMNSANMKQILSSQYGALNYMVLSASMRRRGLYTAGDKGKTKVNIPSRVGQHVKARLMGLVNEEVLPAFEEDVRSTIERSTSVFVERVRGECDSDDECSDTLGSFRKECVACALRYEEEASAECEAALEAVNELKAAIVHIADEAIGEGFESVMNVALDRGKGKGARRAMLDEFAQLAEQMRPDICRRTARRFAERVANEMGKVCYELDTRLMDLRRLVLDRMADARKRTAASMETKEKERVAKQLKAALGKIPARSRQMSV